MADDSVHTEKPADAHATATTAPAREVFPVVGMHCSACSAAVERALNALDGVDAAVSLPSESATVTYDPDAVGFDDLARAVQDAGYALGAAGASSAPGQRERERLARAEAELADARRRMWVAWALAAPAMIWMLPEMFAGLKWPSPVVFDLGMTLIASAVLFGPGGPTLRGAAASTIRWAPNMDVLIALGTGGSLATGVVAVLHELGIAPMLMNYAGVGAMIMAIHLTGRFVEAKARGRSSAAIQRLLSLEASTARVLREGSEVEVPLAEVRAGDEMIVRPGEKVPTDGVVIDGHSAVNEALVTGESMPVEKAPGAEVIGATVNQEGVLHVRATGVGDQTFLASIIRSVEQAQGSKVPIQAFADRVTAIFVPVVLVIAAAALVSWLIFPGFFDAVARWASSFLPWVEPGMGSVSLAIFAALAVLVIACPCALGLATPTALMVGTGLGAEHGVLVRDGAAVQRLKEADVMAFDKTGTLTEGEPAVTDVVTAPGCTGEELWSLARPLEVLSEHPLARAIATAPGSDIASGGGDGDRPTGASTPGKLETGTVEGFRAVPGRGVTGTVRGRRVAVGSEGLMEEEDVDVSPLQERAAQLQAAARSIVFVAADGRLVGMLGLADPIKPGAAEALASLRELGLETLMLTGDNERTAAAVAEQLSISSWHASLLPDQKLDVIRELQANGRVVAMVGDGINDAPSLKQADIGLAIGSGTDIAIEAADMALLQDHLEAAARAVRLSRATFAKIRQNLFWAYFYNVVAIPVAFLGLLHPLIAEGAMAFSSVSVVGNANRLRKVRIDGT